MCKRGVRSAKCQGGGRPYSFSDENLRENIPTYITEGVNRDSLLAVDEAEKGSGKPYRFASLIYIHHDMNNSGKWTELANGDKLWQLQIYSPGARSISFHFDDYRIPKEASLYIFNPNDTTQVIGAFTEINNKESRTFTAGIIKSDYVVLEYFQPKEVVFDGSISIHSIAHGYRSAINNLKDFGDSKDCNNNINCPEWSDWQTVMKSVVMIAVDSSTRICSGAIINNVEEDERNFILTAGHCLDGNESSWLFYFRYEQSDCDSAYDGSLENSLSGCDIKASGEIIDGDFALLETIDTIPHYFDISYAGWSALTTPPGYSHTIHHPVGDVKKISFDSSAVTSGNQFDLWHTHYTPSLTGSGLVEGGSSGAPLFDPNYRIIGQHSGGTADSLICTDTTLTMVAKWGSFEIAFDDLTTDSTTYLKYWLDPNNTGATTLDLLYPNISCCVDPIRGNVDGDSSDICDISDLLYMVDYMFQQGPVPPCEEEADVDGSGELDISDLLYLVDYMFNNSTPPVACP